MEKNKEAVALGRLGGLAKSEAKAKSSRANGALGGRPKFDRAVVFGAVDASNIRFNDYTKEQRRAFRNAESSIRSIRTSTIRPPDNTRPPGPPNPPKPPFPRECGTDCVANSNRLLDALAGHDAGAFRRMGTPKQYREFNRTLNADLAGHLAGDLADSAVVPAAVAENAP